MAFYYYKVPGHIDVVAIFSDWVSQIQAEGLIHSDHRHAFGRVRQGG